MGGVDGGVVGSLNEPLGNNIDGTFLGCEEILAGVFVGASAGAHPDAEDWWVMVDDLGVGVGCQVVLAVSRDG